MLHPAGCLSLESGSVSGLPPSSFDGAQTTKWGGETADQFPPPQMLTQWYLSGRAEQTVARAVSLFMPVISPRNIARSHARAPSFPIPHFINVCLSM